MGKDVSLEYLVARANDPFLSEEERKQHMVNLCDRIEKEFDGACTVVKILSHKLLSPDSKEAMLSLELMDLCVKRCGTKVINEIGKFRVLNQFIRLLSPKFQGLQTSEDVKHKAIFLLFNWKNSFRSCEKIRQVYDLLKEQNIIEDDPPIDDDILHIPKPPPRMAVFEDEEKAQLLEQLLKSKNPEDLQAANRLIKSMVRSEDLKIEKEHKRSEILQNASTNVNLLQDMLENLVRSKANGSPNIFAFDQEDLRLMKEIADSLFNLRPVLFRYASEAAESNEEILSEILGINDQLNRVLQTYKDHVESPQEIDKTKKPIKNLQSHENYTLIKFDNDWTESSSSHAEKPGPSYLDDVSMLTLKSNSNAPNLERKIFHNDLLLDNHDQTHILNGSDGQKVSQYENKSKDEIIPDLADLKLNNETIIIARHDIDHLQSSKDLFLLDDVSVSVGQLQIASKEPVIFINQPFIRGILYLTENLPSGYKNIIFTIATITSFNPLPITNVRLKMCSKNSLVSSKLLSSKQTNLQGFHPAAQAENISQVFMLLPLSESVTHAEINYELTLKSNYDERYEGSFMLKWK